MNVVAFVNGCLTFNIYIILLNMYLLLGETVCGGSTDLNDVVM